MFQLLFIIIFYFPSINTTRHTYTAIIGGKDTQFQGLSESEDTSKFLMMRIYRLTPFSTSSSASSFTSFQLRSGQGTKRRVATSILIRSFASTSSSYHSQPFTKQSTFSNMSTFDVPKRYSKLLGERSLVITSALGDDEESEQFLGYLLTRFDGQGKKMLSMKIKSPFVSSKDINECIELVKRCALESIVVIGNQTCIDVGKAVRETLESGSSSKTHMSSMLALRTKSTNTNANARYSTPLIAIPTNITPTTAIPLWKGLHVEEDYVQDFASYQPPDVVIFDPNLIKGMSLENVSLYLLSSLFDIIFSYVISNEFNTIRREANDDGDDDGKHVRDDTNVDSSGANAGEDKLLDSDIEKFILGILERPEFKSILLLLLDVGMLPNINTSKEKVCEICEAINALHHHLFFASSLSSSASPSAVLDVFDPCVELLSQLSYMRMLHSSKDSRMSQFPYAPLSLPHNLLMIDTFQKILKNPILFKTKIGEGDSELEVSVRRSFITTVSILGLSPQGGLARNIIQHDLSSGTSTKVKDEMNYLFNSSLKNGILSAGGVVGGAQFVEEDMIERYIVDASKAKNIVIKGIYENEETADIVADIQKFSPKLGLLRSDFLLDIVEKSF